MWKVEFESPDVEAETAALIKRKKITNEDRIVIRTWIREMSERGPEAIQGEKIWDDHELYDDWKGYRASCFSYSGRIIYRIDDGVIKILIARISPDHDYRR